MPVGAFLAIHSLVVEVIHLMPYANLMMVLKGKQKKVIRVDHPEICEAPSKPAMSGSERFLCVRWIDVCECVVVHVKQVKSYSRRSVVSPSQERL